MDFDLDFQASVIDFFQGVNTLIWMGLKSPMTDDFYDFCH